MTHIKIKHRFTDAVLFEGEYASIKDAVVEAVKKEVSLLAADLLGAYLQGADLRGANLLGANLDDADLRGVDLRGANLLGANLRDADLRGANLRGANLLGANLSGVFWNGDYLEEADLLVLAPVSIKKIVAETELFYNDVKAVVKALGIPYLDDIQDTAPAVSGEIKYKSKGE
jgi:uncharacterized protein YjbI with pentapeptide repeats